MVLKNDAKAQYPYFDGIYELSPTLDDQGMPKWKIIGGTHVMEYLSQYNEWRLKRDGSKSRLSSSSSNTSKDQMPHTIKDDWHIWNESSNAWVDAASGDINIQGI